MDSISTLGKLISAIQPMFEFSHVTTRSSSVSPMCP
jgi:hypothetical protein